MALTPETLPRHELNGLHARVVDAPNPDLVGIEGRVVVETAQTLHVESAPSEEAEDGESRVRVRQVPKQGSTFEFTLTDEAADSAKESGIASELDSGTATARDDPAQSGAAAGAGTRETDAAAPSGEGATYVTVDGTRLLSRPAERTETRGNSPWQSD